MAKLYFNYSTMNAGKSTLLLQASYNYQERGMRTVQLIAAFDERAGRGVIGSRIGLEASAIPFEPHEDLYKLIAGLCGDGAPISCVFVDEAHFMTAAHVWQLARVVDRLCIPVMVYGLRTDFQGKLFPASQELLAIATRCAKCAQSAIAAVRRRWWCGSTPTARCCTKARRSMSAATRNMSRSAAGTGTTK